MTLSRKNRQTNSRELREQLASIFVGEDILRDRELLAVKHRVPTYRMYRTLSANLPDVKQRSVPRLDHLSAGLSCWQTCSWVPATRHVIIGYIIAILPCGEDAIKWNIFLAVYYSVHLHNRLICKSDCMQKFWGKLWRSEFVLNLALKVNPKRWIFSLGSNGCCMHSVWLLESDCVL